MGAIKDAYDLVEKLYNSTKDKQTLELLFPIKEKLISADKELVEIQRGNNDSVFQLQSEITKLQTENSKLQQRITELELENTSLKNKKLFQGGVIKARPNK